MEINKGWWLLPRFASSVHLSRTVRYILCVGPLSGLFDIQHVLERLSDH